MLSFPDGEYLQLPRMALRRDTHIRMLVLLDGGGERIVTAEGSIAGGELVQDTVRLGAPSKTATRTLVLAIGAAFLALIVAVIVITTTPSPVPIPGVECVAGTLSVSGSTAFEPTNQDLAVRYHTSCPRSTITSHANGSFGGVLDLAIRGRGDPSVRNTSLASSDGPVQGFGGLDRQPLAVVIFSVVVNSADGVYSLTRDELAGIYAGRITNWSELHGPNLPIRVVSRGADSGTRNTFDQKVLGTQPEPPANSHNCVDPDPALPASRVIRCETQSTEEVLQQVNAIPGAIGYAEMSTTSTTYPQLHQIQIAGYDPSPASVKNGAYPFWTVEYFYSYSQPDPGSLAAAFLEFIGTDTAKNIMQQNGHIPCTDPDAQEHKLCQ